jgi:hypothetical protein
MDARATVACPLGRANSPEQLNGTFTTKHSCTSRLRSTACVCLALLEGFPRHAVALCAVKYPSARVHSIFFLVGITLELCWRSSIALLSAVCKERASSHHQCTCHNGTPAYQETDLEIVKLQISA